MASLEYIVNAVDDASGTFSKIGLSADDLSRKLDDLGKKDVAPGVGLDDKEFTAKAIIIADKMKKLKETIKPDMSIEGLAKASLEIDKISTALDKLGHKKVTAEVDVKYKSSGGIIPTKDLRSAALSPKLGGGLLGAPGTTGGGGPSIWKLLASPALLFGSGSAAGAAAGGGGGGGGGGGAAALANPWAIGGISALATAPLGLLDALVGQGVGSGVGAAAFLGAHKYDEKQLDPGFNSINSALRPVFKSVGPSIGLMISQFGRFLHGQQNPLAQLFGSSLPFLQQFIKLGEQVAKTLLPSLTQVMRQFVQTGALKEMTQGFVYLTQGLAIFIRDLGPGFKAGAETFRAISIVVRDTLIALGQVFGGLGGAATHAFGAIHDAWDSFRHWFAGEFDTWRHWWAHMWDSLWNDTIGSLIRFNGTFMHDLGNWLGDVVREFSRLPGQILHVLSSLGRQLESLGRSALNDMWSGFKSISGSILGWIGNFVSDIWKHVKSFFGINSPSSLFYDIGRNLMLGLFHGIKDHAHMAQNAIGGALHPTGSGGTVERLMQSMAASVGWTGPQWTALYNVEEREAGFNLQARNPSSGAYGLAQFIQGPSEYYQYGGNPNTAAGQITGMLNYIKQRYGTPSSAWAHEEQFGWYGKGLKGGLFTRPTLIGVGERGPERVDVTPLGGGRGHGGALVHVDQMVVQDATDINLVSHRLNFLITSASLGP